MLDAQARGGTPLLLRQDYYWSTAAYLLSPRGATALVRAFWAEDEHEEEGGKPGREGMAAWEARAALGGTAEAEQGEAGRGGWRVGLDRVPCVKADLCVIYPTLEALDTVGGGSPQGDGGDPDNRTDAERAAGGGDGGLGAWPAGSGVYVAVPPLFVSAEQRPSAIAGHDVGRQAAVHAFSRAEALAMAAVARAHVQARPRPPPPPLLLPRLLPFRFWVHDHPSLDWRPLLRCLTGWDTGLHSQNAAEVWLLQQLLAHPNRTSAWQDADVVVLPLLPLVSLRAGIACAASDPPFAKTTHRRRMAAAVVATLSHPAYARRWGHDHLVLTNYWDAWGMFGGKGTASHAALANVSFGWHETSAAAWGMAAVRHVGKCQVALPYVETASCAGGCGCQGLPERKRLFLGEHVEKGWGQGTGALWSSGEACGAERSSLVLRRSVPHPPLPRQHPPGSFRGGVLPTLLCAL